MVTTDSESVRKPRKPKIEILDESSAESNSASEPDIKIIDSGETARWGNAHIQKIRQILL